MTRTKPHIEFVAGRWLVGYPDGSWIESFAPGVRPALALAKRFPNGAR